MSEKRQVKCKNNQCHDRYNCKVYDMAAEPTDGVTHVIPLSHRPGDEGCFMYIPKDNLPASERERQLLKDFYTENDSIR